MKILKRSQVTALVVTTLLVFTTSSISFISYSQRKTNSNTARGLRHTLSLYNGLLNSLTTAQSEARGYAFTKKQEILEDYFPAIEESLRIALILERYSPISESNIIGSKSEQKMKEFDNIVRLTNSQQNNLSARQIIEKDKSWDEFRTLLKKQITATENKITAISDANRNKLVVEFWAQTVLIVLLCFLLFLCIRIYLAQERAKIQLEYSFHHYKTETDTVKQRTYEMVAHEIRVPLQIIIGYLSLLKLNNFSAERIKSVYTEIDSAINRIINIVDTMLFLSSDAKPIFQIKDITVICKTIIEQMKVIVTNSLVIEHIPDCDIPLNINESVFTSFLNNIMSNAIKYSPPGEPITVSIEQDASEVRITVCDLGIGIPESELSQLFNPFFRASNTGSIKGTGLGLVIAKKSVETHGGTLEVKSIEGIGTTFKASFPKL